MSDPAEKLKNVVPATLTKRGDLLEGPIRTSGRAKDAKPKQITRPQWDDALAEHVATMADGESVDVEVIIDRANDGKRTARLAGIASLVKIAPDGDRDKAVQAGGFVNPYTFVPTLPRSSPNGTRLAGTGLDDTRPPSHAYHDDGQWSGILALTLTTTTPLLLPVPAAGQPKDGVRTFDVRVDPDGRPLIHGASFKGALRSAYETVTASRYGVFFEHHDRLAYRVPANAALALTPARVHRNEDGTGFFRLCRGDNEWLKNSQKWNEVQHAAWIPAYNRQGLDRIGDLAKRPLTDFHRDKVHARVVLYQYRRDRSGKVTQFQVWRATHLARSRGEIETCLGAASTVDPDHAGNLTRIHEVSPRLVQGWLSATGHSIGSKHDERLFVEGPDPEDVPITPEHERYWRSVLRAYDLAQGYNDPNATYSRDAKPGARGVVRSFHVPSDPELRTLPNGTLVYVKYDDDTNTITEVHPVMIGRLPFDAAPDKLLHESLRPTQDRDQLSPADRLFGWVPPGRREDGAETNDGASGYRGRLRVKSITCTTDDWRPPSFPSDGVTLAPLSSPKPTQFRFYASPDQTGTPMPRQAKKDEGYAAGGGLRGRKMYRWREENPEYWQPTKGQNDPARGYLALKDHEKHATQLVRHRSWVRPGVTFQVELFLDGVPEAELGALLWLLNRGDDAPLRLGAGKPFGFGVATTRLDADRTRLWDAARVRAGWLRLARPDPVDPKQLIELADRFDTTARGNEVLREATESYRSATKPVTEPVHYPRETPEPQAESYKWFVANDRIKGGEVGEGWALPHVRDAEQRLPYLDAQGSSPNRTGRGTGNSRDRQLRKPPPPRQVQRSEPTQGTGSGQGAGRAGSGETDRRGRRPS